LDIFLHTTDKREVERAAPKLRIKSKINELRKFKRWKEKKRKKEEHEDEEQTSWIK